MPSALFEHKPFGVEDLSRKTPKDKKSVSRLRRNSPVLISLGLLVVLAAGAAAGEVQPGARLRTRVEIDASSGLATVTTRLLPGDPVRIHLASLQQAPGNMIAKTDIDEVAVERRPDDTVEAFGDLYRPVTIPAPLVAQGAARELQLPPDGCIAVTFPCWSIPRWPDMVALASGDRGILLSTYGGIFRPDPLPPYWALLPGSVSADHAGARLSAAEIRRLGAAARANQESAPTGPAVRTRVWLDVPTGRVSIRIRSAGTEPVAVDAGILGSAALWIGGASAGVPITAAEPADYRPATPVYLLPGEAIGSDVPPDSLAIIASVDAAVRAKRTVALSLAGVWVCGPAGWSRLPVTVDAAEPVTAPALREARLHARERDADVKR